MPKDNIKEPEVKTPPVENSTPDPNNYEVVVNMQDPKMRVQGIRLNIGSGVDYRPGFLNIDAFDKSDADWDIKSMPLKSHSVAQIVCLECLEHLPRMDAQKALIEMHRILKPGGNLIMVVPNIVATCRDLLENPEDNWIYARMFGSQNHPGQFHMNSFTHKKISDMCGFAGFRLIGCAYFGGKNEDESIYVEAIK